MAVINDIDNDDDVADIRNDDDDDHFMTLMIAKVRSAGHRHYC